MVIDIFVCVCEFSSVTMVGQLFLYIYYSIEDVLSYRFLRGHTTISATLSYDYNVDICIKTLKREYNSAAKAH